LSDCVIVQPIAEAGVDFIRQAGLSVFVAPSANLDDMRAELADARIVVTRNLGFSAEQIAAAPRLRVIGVHGTGTDRIDQVAAGERGIAVVNTPGTNARSVAEHALALMLALAKSLPAAHSAVRAGHFAFREGAPVFELTGRRLGLVGWGRTARELAGLARALSMGIAVWSSHADAEELKSHRARKVGDLDELCAASDVLSLHGLPSGAPIIDRRRIGLMPQGALLINTARAALVDNAALVAALRSGHLSGAGIDVFAPEPPRSDDPLLSDCPNLILTPHIGGSAREALERTAVEVARRVLAAAGHPA